MGTKVRLGAIHLLCAKSHIGVVFDAAFPFLILGDSLQCK